jgi:hypothetical protein
MLKVWQCLHSKDLVGYTRHARDSCVESIHTRVMTGICDYPLRKERRENTPLSQLHTNTSINIVHTEWIRNVNVGNTNHIIITGLSFPFLLHALPHWCLCNILNGAQVVGLAVHYILKICDTYRLKIVTILEKSNRKGNWLRHMYAPLSFPIQAALQQYAYCCASKPTEVKPWTTLWKIMWKHVITNKVYSYRWKIIIHD